MDSAEAWRLRSRYDRLPVGELSRREVSQSAGVDVGYVDRLVELGILNPGTRDTFTRGDVLRARWVQNLERAGVPLDGMATAVRDGALSFGYLDASAFDRFVGLGDSTFQELSERTGIPVELLMVVREAVGFAEPRPQDLLRRMSFRSSQEVVDAADGAMAFTEVGPVELKGVSDTLRLYTVRRGA